MHFSGKEGPGESGVGCGQENKIMKAGCTRLGGLCRREGKGITLFCRPENDRNEARDKTVFFFFFLEREFSFRHANLEVTAEFQGVDS